MRSTHTFLTGIQEKQSADCRTDIRLVFTLRLVFNSIMFSWERDVLKDWDTELEEGKGKTKKWEEFHVV